MILFIKIDRKQHKQDNTILIIHYMNYYVTIIFPRQKYCLLL